MNDLKNLKVTARAPFQIYFEGEALVVSGANKVGKFDILPGHANFFSVINPDSEIVIGTDKEDTHIKVSNGIVTAKDDEVLLFLDI
ncbi:MAG: hypothetical protein ACREF7_04170 [Candidatus Saccharimonadales bacterium]